MTEIALDARSAKSRRLATTAHALGNVFLGLALGLAVYYGVTDLAGRARQMRLKTQITGFGAMSAEDPEAFLGKALSAPMDFEQWAEQDEKYWTELPEGEAFGRLIISEMGLDTVVVKGHSREDLKRGPGWIDYTDLPGATGNCGISGHRTTYMAPFRNLDELSVGDTIDLYSPFRRYRYQVVEVLVVTPDSTEVLFSTEEPMLTLTACHPPYSARYRLVVQAKLIEVRRFVDSNSPSDK